MTRRPDDRPTCCPQRCPQRCPAGDGGTVLVLLLGLTVVLLALTAVVVDVSQVILAKRALASATDGAAAAAAQQLDAPLIRRDGLGAATRLDPDLVSAAVADYARQAAADQPGIVLRGEVSPDDPTTATVTGTRTVRLALVGWLGVDPLVQIEARTAVRSPIGSG